MSRQASNICRSLRPGFTLVEVLVASAVLATISTGLLVTSWRLAAFARDEAEHMIADAFCHDMMWALYSQEKILDGKSSVGWFKIDKECLPRIECYDFWGRRKNGTNDVIPLWRLTDRDGKPLANKQPECRVRVTNNGEEDKKRTIVVEVRWYNGSVSDPQIHSNVVTKAAVERKGES